MEVQGLQSADAAPTGMHVQAGHPRRRDPSAHPPPTKHTLRPLIRCRCAPAAGRQGAAARRVHRAPGPQGLQGGCVARSAHPGPQVTSAAGERCPQPDPLLTCVQCDASDALCLRAKPHGPCALSSPFSIPASLCPSAARCLPCCHRPAAPPAHDGSKPNRTRGRLLPDALAVVGLRLRPGRPHTACGPPLAMAAAHAACCARLPC